MTNEEALHVLNDIGRYCRYYMGEATRQNNWERYERLLKLYQTAETAIEALKQPAYCKRCGAKMEVEK